MLDISTSSPIYDPTTSETQGIYKDIICSLSLFYLYQFRIDLILLSNILYFILDVTETTTTNDLTATDLEGTKFLF